MTKRTALVTGAGGGIGAACAIRLAQDGMRVGVLDLDEGRCAETVASIVDRGGEAVALGADVSNRGQVFAAAEKLRAAFGPVTVLVNNAGIAGFIPFEETTDEVWDRMFAINTRGPFVCTQAVLADMKAAKWGRIVHISSSSAQTGSVNVVAYSSSKGAVVTMTRSMSQEFGPFGITVNNIPPGAIMGTPMSEANQARFPIPVEKLVEAIPVGRVGEPDDIANACSWLCLEASSYVSGQTIGVNGGRVVS